MIGCGGGKSQVQGTPAVTTGSTPGSTATHTGPTEEPDIKFDCPKQWAQYTCPTLSENKGSLSLPYHEGVDAQMMCENIGFYTSGVINAPSILFKLPANTEIVSPINGVVESTRSAPAPHEYTKSLVITGMPFMIYVYFVGDFKVADNTQVKRGDVIAVSSGAFPTDNPTDLKMNGASVVMNLIGYDSRMVDATSQDVWAGLSPSCYTP